MKCLLAALVLLAGPQLTLVEEVEEERYERDRESKAPSMLRP